MKHPTHNTLNSVAAGETRVGLLFGGVETRQPKAGTSKQPVRGRAVNSLASEKEEGPKVVVRVAAVMELDGAFQKHGYVG